MNAQKTAVLLFASSLLCLALVTLFSSDINLKYDTTNPQDMQWTLPKEESDKPSSLEFSTLKQGNVVVSIVIEERQSIDIAYEKCRKYCNRFFAIDKIQYLIRNNQLVLDFNQAIKKKGYNRIVIKLPSRDWQIKCPAAIGKRAISCERVTNNAKPINLEWIANSNNHIEGNFRHLTVWQVNDLPYQASQEITAGKIDTFTAYGNRMHVRFEDVAIQHIDIHSPDKGRFQIYDFTLLERSTWQPLTETEKSRLAALSAQDNADSEKAE